MMEAKCGPSHVGIGRDSLINNGFDGFLLFTFVAMAKNAIDDISLIMRCMLWDRKDKLRISWVMWYHICSTPWRRLDGVDLLKLHERVVP